MKNLYIFILSIGLFAFFIVGCQQDEIITYQAENSAIYFTSMLNQYSFFYEKDAESLIVSVPVTLIGPKVPYDRKFSAQVIDSVTTAPASKYEILEGIVEADSLNGFLKLKIYNSDNLIEDTYTLGLELIPSDELRVGLPTKLVTKVTWNAFVPRPEWWAPRSFGRYISYISIDGKKALGVYSTKLYQIIIDVWGTGPINAYGYLGTTPEILEKYPMIVPGAPVFSAMMRELQQYVYEYNLAHPDAPLRHSKDAAVYNSSGNVTAVFPNEPLIQVNPYNL